MEVNGNISGVKRATLERMAALYDLRIESDHFINTELALLLAEFTEELGREVSVYIGRDGRICDVSIGSGATVRMPSMRLVRNQERLCGLRCVHTHPGGSGMLSSVDLGTLKSMKLDAMCAIGVQEGMPVTVSAAFLGEREGEDFALVLEGPVPYYAIDHAKWLEEMEKADQRLIQSTVETDTGRRERALLIGVQQGDEPYDTLLELAELAETANLEVVRMERQRRQGADSAYYIGKGKAEEISLMAAALGIDLFVFDDELSTVQIRNLEEILGARVIDRTALILDIFAARAQSREGKLQVELAQLKYRLPRLIGLGQTLSRLGGGIGTRGPGEKKLETDRRRIRKQIFELECALEETKKQRALRRRSRERNAVPVAAIVGYTNAGKSTLLNLLSDSDVLAEDKLFATLDPVTRNIKLPDGGEVLITDTVGFINKLPTDLVEAFQSTLEEAAYADIILHVCDVSAPNMREQMRVVGEVLDSIGAGDKPTLHVYNKTDKLETPFSPGERDAVCISALRNRGIGELLARIQEVLEKGQRAAEFVIPYTRGDVVSLLQQRSRVLSEEYLEEGVLLRVVADDATLGMARKQLGITIPSTGE